MVFMSSKEVSRSLAIRIIHPEHQGRRKMEGSVSEYQPQM
jgi:hypothetical protein